MTRFRAETVTALTAVRAALELAEAGAGEVHVKAGRDVVTDTDVAVEDQVRHALRGVSAWPVIGEEKGGDVPDSTPFWLVDPICGTRNFASGIPLYSVNVALVEGGSVTIAAVGDGLTGDVLLAEHGNGAWRLRHGQSERLTARASSRILDLGAWPVRGPLREAAARAAAETIAADRWDVRCFSTSLSIAYVATGQVAGCVLFAAPDPLHVAASCLLVGEAGGRVTDAGGQAWSLDASSIVCAADARLHEELLGFLLGTGHVRT